MSRRISFTDIDSKSKETWIINVSGKVSTSMINSLPSIWIFKNFREP